MTTLPARAEDGLTLMAKTSGAAQLPPLFFLNGLGGSWHAWSHQLAHFSRSHRIIAWDYRGTYQSPAPAGDRLDVRQHALDALCILDAAAPDQKVSVLGWSLGVQVALELYHLAPDRFANLILIGGVPGRTWESLPIAALSKRLVPSALRLAQKHDRFATAFVNRASRAPELLVWAKATGFVSEDVDAELWSQLAESFADLNMRDYLRILEELGNHDAWHVLPNITVPTLVITGDRDRFTPRKAAEQMVRQIPNAQFMLVSGGTHYVAAEYPNLINLRVEKFLSEHA